MIYTIGHSNIKVEEFVSLLKHHKITQVIDVRFTPYSAYVSWADKEMLQKFLLHRGFKYRYAGEYLGFDSGISESDFIKGIKAALHYSKQEKTVLMCAEREPWECHRHYKIAKYLILNKISDVSHIIGNKIIIPKPSDFSEEIELL